MNQTMLQLVAQEISHRLTMEMESSRTVELALPAATVNLLLQHLAEAVAGQSTVSHLGPEPIKENGPVTLSLEARLEKVEQKLRRLARPGRDDEQPSPSPRLPDRDDANPKYEGVESILKYVDAGDDKSAVRLVIMNFND